MREAELDGLRAIALARVVLWHTLAAAWITWIVSAVPAMFFVTGSLLAASLQRRPSWAVVHARARRLLVPLAVYSAAVLVGMLVLADGRGGPAAGGWWRWMVPLWDPTGPGWADGWGSSHLWYLRAYLWVLLAVPFVWWAWRRRPGLVTAGAVVAFAAVEVAPWSGTPAWRVGDLLLYGLFTIGGFWHRAGAFRTVRPGHRLAAGLLAFTGAGVVVLAVGMPPGGVVNDDHLLHLLMGAGWLAVIGAVERPFTAWCTRPSVAAVLGLVSRRSLTIYLWHPLAIVLGYWVLEQVGRDATGPVGSVVLLVLVVAGTLVAVAAVGWVEDLAARRSPERGPRLVAVAGAMAVAAAAVVATPAASAATGTSLDVALPKAPSRAPEALVFDDTPATTGVGTVPAAAAPPAAGALASWGPEGFVLLRQPGRLDEAEVGAVALALMEELVATTATDGVTVAVSIGGDQWVGAAGSGRYGDPDAQFLAWSVTKLLTASLAETAALEGRLDLDRPVQSYVAFDLGAYAAVTTRQLLAHQGGLADYKDVDGWLGDDGQASPMDALEAVLAMPPRFAPGTQVEYSSSNTLLVGMVLEARYGLSFEALAEQYVLRPLGMDDSFVWRSRWGSPGGAAAGVVTTAADLARFVDAWLGDAPHQYPEHFAEILASIGDDGLGEGVMAWCPCTVAGGQRVIRWVGHHGANTLVLHDMARGLTVVVQTDASLHGDDGIGEAVHTMVDRLADALADALTQPNSTPS